MNRVRINNEAFTVLKAYRRIKRQPMFKSRKAGKGGVFISLPDFEYAVADSGRTTNWSKHIINICFGAR